MKYREFKRELEEYNKVIVSGPQRSGTRIAAKIFADDFELSYYQEEKINIYNFDKLEELINNENNFVIQCPGVSSYLHKISEEDVAVVFLRRDVGDIISSQKRIGWEWEDREYRKYEENFDISSRKKPISLLSYEIWDDTQKEIIQNSYDLDYESLSIHNLFVPKENRVDFSKDQTEHD